MFLSLGLHGIQPASRAFDSTHVFHIRISSVHISPEYVSMGKPSKSVMIAGFLYAKFIHVGIFCAQPRLKVTLAYDSGISTLESQRSRHIRLLARDRVSYFAYAVNQGYGQSGANKRAGCVSVRIGSHFGQNL